MAVLAKSVTIGPTTYPAGTDSATMPAAAVDAIRNPDAWVNGDVPALSSGGARATINPSDLLSPSRLAAALGLKSAAFKNVGGGSNDVAPGNVAGGNSVIYGTAEGTAAQGNDSRITGAAQKAANLSDLASAATARANLGLGGAAVLGVGTATGSVAAGDDSRITGAAQKSANLSDLASASTARTNLGLGGAAVLDVGTGSGNVAAGNAPAAAVTAAVTAAATDATEKAVAAQNAAIGAAAGLAIVLGGI